MPTAFHGELHVKNATRAYFAGQGPATVLPSGVNAILRSRPGLDAPDMQIMFGAGALEGLKMYEGERLQQPELTLKAAQAATSSARCTAGPTRRAASCWAPRTFRTTPA